MDKIKVCHITTVHPSRYDVRIFEKECSFLAEHGFDVTLIVNDEMKNEVKNGVKIMSLKKKTKNRLDRMFRLSRVAYKKALQVDADIYHIHDPELMGVGKKLRKRNKKVVYDSHEFTAMQILTKDYIPAFLRKTISKMYRGYESRTINKLSGLVYPCTCKGRDYFFDINVPKVIIGNFPSKSIVDVNRKNEKSDEFKVCYVGSVTETRGVYEMVRAAHLADKKLVLIGDVSEDIRNRLQEMPEASNIELLGQLPHDEALEEVAKCSVGLSLLQKTGQYSYLDNLPTKLYEYMSLGIPTVISDFPYYKKTLKKYKFGIAVDPSDEQQIADAINKIYDDPKLAEEMVAEGQRAILSEMNWESDGEKLVDFYNRI